MVGALVDEAEGDGGFFDPTEAVGHSLFLWAMFGLDLDINAVFSVIQMQSKRLKLFRVIKHGE